MAKADKIGILAGGGKLPAYLIEHFQKENIPFCIITFKGQPAPACSLEGVEQTQVILGQVGKAIKFFKECRVKKIVFAGNLVKPSLACIRPDFIGLKVISKVTFNHDNEVLNAVSAEFLKEGMKLVGAHEILPKLVITEGCFTKTKPLAAVKQTIDLGISSAKSHGEKDLGQAVVVKNNTLLGLEDEKGTDALIKRVASENAILVKLAKPQQNLKLDMPTIGPDTIKNLAENNYAGVVVGANKTIFLDAEKTIELANEHKIFIVGVNV